MLIEMRGIAKRYQMGSHVVNALDGVDLDVDRNEYLALMGPSGSGKTTFMNIIGCLDSPTEGRYVLNGEDVTSMSDDTLAHIRNKEIGFVFQTFNLLPRASAFQNVELPLIYAGLDAGTRRERAAAALEAVGLQDRAHHKPNELSGGQRQRVAIARAILKNAPVLILDEATSALDAESEHLVRTALAGLVEGRTTLVIAHRLTTIERADRIVVMDGGRIVESGTHAELLAAGGVYAALHRMQFNA